MRSLVLITNYWVHLFSAVFWIGGIMFILFIALPVSTSKAQSGGKEVMGEIAKRFGPLANWCIYLLVATGAVMTWSMRPVYMGNIGNIWTWVFVSKMLPVSVMIAIHFFRGLVLSGVIDRTEPGIGKARLQKLSLNLVKVNLSLGLLVLLLSAVLSIQGVY
ncbi:MAG: DUF4149 domain-containing protein [Desulfobacteria bacterium]